MLFFDKDFFFPSGFRNPALLCIYNNAENTNVNIKKRLVSHWFCAKECKMSVPHYMQISLREWQNSVVTLKFLSV